MYVSFITMTGRLAELPYLKTRTVVVMHKSYHSKLRFNAKLQIIENTNNCCAFNYQVYILTYHYDKLMWKTFTMLYLSISSTSLLFVTFGAIINTGFK